MCRQSGRAIISFQPQPSTTTIRERETNTERESVFRLLGTLLDITETPPIPDEAFVGDSALPNIYIPQLVPSRVPLFVYTSVVVVKISPPSPRIVLSLLNWITGLLDCTVVDWTLVDGLSLSYNPAKYDITTAVTHTTSIRHQRGRGNPRDRPRGNHYSQDQSENPLTQEPSFLPQIPDVQSPSPPDTQRISQKSIVTSSLDTGCWMLDLLPRLPFQSSAPSG